MCTQIACTLVHTGKGVLQVTAPHSGDKIDTVQVPEEEEEEEVDIMSWAAVMVSSVRWFRHVHYEAD